MSTSYYRIQDNNRPVEQLLDPEFQMSISYSTDTVRRGVSVCRSLEDLAAYLVASGVPFDRYSVVVEVEGDWSVDEDEDAHLGAELIHPTKIVSVAPMTDELEALIEAECVRLGF